MPDDGSKNCSVSKWIIITETCECGYSESPDDKKNGKYADSQSAMALCVVYLWNILAIL